MKIVNFAHFFKDTRSVLELNGELPKLERGYPKDGNLMLSLSNEKGERKAFKLSVVEASRLVFALQNFIMKHEDEFARLSERTPAKAGLSAPLSERTPAKAGLSTPLSARNADNQKSSLDKDKNVASASMESDPLKDILI
ncbi:hypothetical protein COT72_02215 [archaeon CG10_big_fil_rev_8_21_14_0_10_43_11]|nr:MAG: hypothetical protein COT72_02215 [archaeon CG10_big_fil_rev_8_21_14_0_10_43_11]